MPGEPRFSDVSRILFPLTRAAVIYLARMPERPAPFWRRFATFGASAQPKWCGVRLVPEVSNFRLRGKNRARRPCPLLCLAPHGVSHATSFTRRSGGLLPRLFNLAPHHFGGALPFLALGRSQSGAGRYIFCDTFRHLELSPQLPSLFARHAALWCSDFPLAQQGIAPATTRHSPTHTTNSCGVPLAEPPRPQSGWQGERIS